MSTSQRGFIISFEGMEGAGKTTQCTLLAEKLQKMGKETVIVREPGGVPIAEEIRSVVLNPREEKMAVTTEVLLFQAARAQLYAEIVLPALAEGKVVLMDRTRDSSTIYQGMVRGIGVETIEYLNNYSTQNTFPAITVLLDLPATVGMERRTKLGKLDRIEREGIPLQEKVCAAYLEVARENKEKRWVIIDGTASIEAVAKNIWQAVEPKLTR